MLELSSPSVGAAALEEELLLVLAGAVGWVSPSVALVVEEAGADDELPDGAVVEPEVGDVVLSVAVGDDVVLEPLVADVLLGAEADPLLVDELGVSTAPSSPAGGV